MSIWNSAPAATQRRPEWQAAAEVLILVAERKRHKSAKVYRLIH